VREPVVLDGFVPSAALAQMVAGGTAPLGEKTRQTAGYWLAIGHLLDLFVACGAEVAATAERVGVGSAALARLLTHDPAVLRTANQHRTQRGLRPLR
jgi:hypothetical protein